MFPPNPQPFPEDEDPLMQAEQALAPQPGLFPARMETALDYRVPLSVDRRRLLGRELVEAYTAFKGKMDQRLENARMWRNDVEMGIWDGPTPWSGASQVRAPLTSIACRSHAQRLNTLLCQADPPFRARADSPEAVQWLRAIEDVLTEKLEKAKWEDVAREIHEALPIDAAGMIGVFYRQKQARYPVPQMDYDETVTDELAGMGLDFAEAMQAGVQTDDKGQAKLHIGFEAKTRYDGPEFRFCPMERMVVLPATAERLEDVWGLGERLTIRGVDLKRGVKQKIYDGKAVKELLKRGSDAKDTEEDDDYEDASGVEQGDPFEPFSGDEDFKEYQVVELYLLHDLNHDGEQEWYCVTFHPDTNLILRCQYSPYEDGECPWVPFGYIKRPGRFWSQSIAERNAVMQSSATVALNMAHNLSDIYAGSGSSFFYGPRAFARGNAPGSWEWVPGKPWPCSDPNDIKPIVFPQIAQALQAQLEIYGLIKSSSELLCSTSDVTLGKEATGDKTAREVSLVANAAHQGFQDYAVTVALCWQEVMRRFVSRIAQYAEGGMVDYSVPASANAAQQREVYQVDEGGMPQPVPVAPGEMGFGRVPAELLRLPVTLAPAGIFGYADAETRLRASMLILQTLSENPLTSQMPEVLLEALDQFITDSRAPNAEQLTTKLYEGWAQLQQAMQAQAMLQQAAMTQQAAAQEEQLALQSGQADQQMALQREQMDRDGQAAAVDQQMAQEKHSMEMAGWGPPQKTNGKGGKK